LAGLAILLLALTPVRAAASQRALDDALAAFRAGDCGTAVDRALDAQSALGTRPEPFELLGYCDVRAGEHRLAERMMRTAVRRDSRSWELWYGLAIVQGAGGKDPRPALRQALDRNPMESVVRSAAERMRSANPRVWKREARNSVVIIPQPTQADGR
jgi:Flp pilus assembly protein TadD